MLKKNESTRLLPIAIVGIILGGGCVSVPPEVQQKLTQFQGEWSRIQALVKNELSDPAAMGTATVAASASSIPSEEFASELARRSKANSELLHEMIQVVLQREPKDRALFGSYVDTLNQGASFEGIYNGLTHSADYRRMETTVRGANPKALKAFAEELAELEIQLPVLTVFDEGAAEPLAKPVELGMVEPVGEGVSVVEYGTRKVAATQSAPSPSPSIVPLSRAALSAHYERIFAHSSVYTMKRVIGDEALKVIALKRETPEKAALWYSKWVNHMAERKVDFGLGLRNKSDEPLHYKWALTAGMNHFQWEVLNRLHRVINLANR